MKNAKSELPVESLRRRFRIKNRLVVNLLSELFGTWLLLFVGTGISMQFVIGKGLINNFMHVAFGWGMLVGLCVYCTFKTSGNICRLSYLIKILIFNVVCFSFFTKISKKILIFLLSIFYIYI